MDIIIFCVRDVRNKDYEALWRLTYKCFCRKSDIKAWRTLSEFLILKKFELHLNLLKYSNIYHLNPKGVQTFRIPVLNLQNKLIMLLYFLTLQDPSGKCYKFYLFRLCTLLPKGFNIILLVKMLIYIYQGNSFLPFQS